MSIQVFLIGNTKEVEFYRLFGLKVVAVLCAEEAREFIIQNCSYKHTLVLAADWIIPHINDLIQAQETEDKLTITSLPNSYGNTTNFSYFLDHLVFSKTGIKICNIGD